MFHYFDEVNMDNLMATRGQLKDEAAMQVIFCSGDVVALGPPRQFVRCIWCQLVFKAKHHTAVVGLCMTCTRFYSPVCLKTWGGPVPEPSIRPGPGVCHMIMVIQHATIMHSRLCQQHACRYICACHQMLTSPAHPLAAAAAQGTKLTFLPFIVKALSLALLKHPEINSCLASGGDALLQHHTHNIGVAMATASGLVVPNVKQVGGWCHPGVVGGTGQL
jgi:hypothetical protein